MNHSRPSQESRVLDVMRRRGSINTIQAVRMGILRLGARIYKLKRAGHPIDSQIVKRGGARVGKYTLLK